MLSEFRTALPCTTSFTCLLGIYTQDNGRLAVVFADHPRSPNQVNNARVYFAAEAMKRCTELAGLKPADVDFFQTYWTSTLPALVRNPADKYNNAKLVDLFETLKDENSQVYGRAVRKLDWEGKVSATSETKKGVVTLFPLGKACYPWEFSEMPKTSYDPATSARLIELIEDDMRAMGFSILNLVQVQERKAAKEAEAAASAGQAAA